MEDRVCKKYLPPTVSLYEIAIEKGMANSGNISQYDVDDAYQTGEWD